MAKDRNQKKLDRMMKKMVRKEEKKKKRENKTLKGKTLVDVKRGNVSKSERDGKAKGELRKMNERKEMKEKDKKRKRRKKHRSGRPSPQRIFVFFLLSMIAIAAVFFFYTRDAVQTFFLFSGAVLLFGFYLIVRKRMERYNRIKKMELVFPDFISLMSSNLRAGMTVDRALLTSARKEFYPLDREIMQVGKDILTGGEISEALKDMSVRINSEEIKKTIQLIISGIRSGGNLSVLLEETATNMRERIFVKKRAASNVLMYVIFIFFAVSIGAPLLFGLSNVLVEIMASIFSDVDVGSVNLNLPFTLTEITISTTFVFYFSIIFIAMTAILASLILGLVSKGKEREGLKYIAPLVAVSLGVFLLSRLLLLRYFADFFSG